jgi:RNA polymerase sigma-70 factor (ECF subfamily)
LIILKDPILAEEAAHDAFLKAYEKLETLKEPKKFGAWVAMIAFNHSKNLYNKNKRTVPIENHELIDYFDETVIVNNDPLGFLEELDLRREMSEAIDRLNPTLKQLIILKYYLELPDAEIAQMMDMPLGTVKSSLYRAKKNLSEILPSINKDYLRLVKGGER